MWDTVAGYLPSWAGDWLPGADSRRNRRMVAIGLACVGAYYILKKR